jgi:hypothetical protein
MQLVRLGSFLSSSLLNLTWPVRQSVKWRHATGHMRACHTGLSSLVVLRQKLQTLVWDATYATYHHHHHHHHHVSLSWSPANYLGTHIRVGTDLGATPFYASAVSEHRKLLCYLRGPFEKFVDWRQCAAVMNREAVTYVPSCSGGGNVVVAWSSSL